MLDETVTWKCSFYFHFALPFCVAYLKVLFLVFLVVLRVLFLPGERWARTFPTGFILFDFSCLDAGPAELLDLSQWGFSFWALGSRFSVPYSLFPIFPAVVGRVSHQHQQHSEKYLLPFVGTQLSPAPGLCVSWKLLRLRPSHSLRGKCSYLTGQRQILRVVSYFYPILFVCFSSFAPCFLYCPFSRGKRRCDFRCNKIDWLP